MNENVERLCSVVILPEEDTRGSVGMGVAIAAAGWNTAAAGAGGSCRRRGDRTRCQQDPVRPLTEAERVALEQLSRARSAPAGHVARAPVVLAVTAGRRYTAAAREDGRRSGDAGARLVARRNREGLAAIVPRRGGGAAMTYGEAGRARLLTAVRRAPDPAVDGTAPWSRSTLRRALRTASDGLPGVRDTQSGAPAQGWAGRGDRPRRRPQKQLIEAPYRLDEAAGLALWTADEAGP